MRKKLVPRRLLTTLLALAMLVQSIGANAGYATIATNGNQKINIQVKVANENNAPIKGAEVTLKAHDFNIFAKTQNLSLTASTNGEGVATFKISSTYDRIRGIRVIGKGISEISKSLDDFIGLTKTKRTYSYKAAAIKHSVKFYNADGLLYDVQYVKDGEAAVEPKIPEYTGDSIYRMEFSGWDKDFSKVTEDMDVKAEYTIGIAINRNYMAYIEAPEGSSLDRAIPASNDAVIYSDYFIDRDHEEQDGIIATVNNVEYTLESLVKFRTHTMNKTMKSIGMFLYQEGNDYVYGWVNKKTGLGYKTLLSDVDFYKVVRPLKNGSVINGTSWGKIYGKSKNWTTFYTVRYFDAAGNVIDTQEVDEINKAIAPKNVTYNGDSDYTMKFVGWEQTYNNLEGTFDNRPIYEKGKRNCWYRLFVKKPAELGGHIGITHNNPLYCNPFGYNDEYVEGEDGYVMMSDGAKISVESGMNLTETKICINKSQVGCYDEIVDGIHYICVEGGNGVVYKMDLSSVNWNRVSNKNGQIWGEGIWVKVTQ